MFEFLQKQVAIRQAGQGIEIGLIPDNGLGVFAFGYITNVSIEFLQVCRIDNGYR